MAKGKAGYSASGAKSTSGVTNRDIGPVLKSPSDPKSYKAIELPNGLKAVLISTCPPESGLPPDPKPKKISDFNKAFLKFDTYAIPDGEDGSSEPLSARKSWLDKGKAAMRSLSETSIFSKKDSEPEPPPSTSENATPSSCSGPVTLCLAVGAGSYLDPPEINGLAHLVEHLIFLGSNRYPEANHLIEKVHEYSGQVNAATEGEYTYFFFSLNSSDGFECCLDILGDALKAPLLLKERTRREVEAVDSEYGIKQSNDLLRVYDFLRSLASVTHPIRKFYWGNKESLAHPNLADCAWKWIHRYYRADYMTLCIHASMPLKDIESVVTKCLSDIPRSEKDWPRPSEELSKKYGSPFEPSAFATLYRLLPVTDINELIITWNLPSKYWLKYETKPLLYLQNMITTRSEGGLVNYLEDNMWITNLHSSCSTNDNFFRNRFCSLYKIHLILTDKGVAELDTVIATVFSYLRLLKMGGVKRRYFEEMKRSLSNAFHFRNWDDDPLSNCETIAIALQTVAPKHVITSQWLITEYSEDILRSCFNLLTPREANFIFVSRTNSDVCTKEAWNCGICHKKCPISEERYCFLENVPLLRNLSLPRDNAFLMKEIELELPSDCDLLNVEKDGGVVYEDPEEKLKIMYRSEQVETPLTTPEIPCTEYYIRISSPLICPTLAKQGVWDMMTEVVRQRVARKLGFQFSYLFYEELVISPGTICITVAGPRGGLLELVTHVISTIFEDVGGTEGDKSDEAQETMYANLRTEKLRYYSNQTLDVESLADDILVFLLRDSHATFFQLHNELAGVGFDDFKAVLGKAWRKMMIEVDIQGDVLESDVEELKTLFQRYNYQTCMKEMFGPDRATVLPPGTSLLHIQAAHPSYVISIISNHYQIGLWNERWWGQVTLLSQIMKQPLENQLRLKEQLGYAVACMPTYDSGGSIGLAIVVYTQPSKFSTDHVQRRIANFLHAFYKVYIQKPAVMQRLAAPYLEDPDDLQQFQEFFTRYFRPCGGGFRLLAIHIEGCHPDHNSCRNQIEAHTNQEKGETNDSDRIIRLNYMVPKKGKKDSNKNTDDDRFRVITSVHDFKRTLPLFSFL